MSSDSDHKYQVIKRRRLVIRDDESSDESVIVRSHRKKQVHVRIQNLILYCGKQYFNGMYVERD